MGIIKGNNKNAVLYPNLPAGQSTSTTFATQQDRVNGDVANLQRDQQHLADLNKNRYLTPQQAQDAVATAAQLKTDAAQFQSDQQALLQIAAQDGSTDEAAPATGLAGSGNSFINQAAQEAGTLETNHALDNGLGGISSPTIGVYHNNINAAASSANQVSFVNTNSPQGANSPFQPGGTSQPSAGGTSQPSAGGSGGPNSPTTTAVDLDANIQTSSGANIDIHTHVQIDDPGVAPATTNSAAVPATSNSAPAATTTNTPPPATQNPPPAVPQTAGTAVTTATFNVTESSNTSAGPVNETIAVQVPVDAQGNPVTTATVDSHTLISYTTASGSVATIGVEFDVTVGPGGVTSSTGPASPSQPSVGGDGSPTSASGGGGPSNASGNGGPSNASGNGGPSTPHYYGTISSQGVTYSYGNLGGSTNVSTSFANQSAVVQNDLTAVQADTKALSDIYKNASGNLSPSQASAAVSLAAKLKTDSATFNKDENQLLRIAVRNNNINEANTAVYAYGDAAFSAISTGAGTLWDMEHQKNLDGGLGGQGVPAINDMHVSVDGAIALANNIAHQDAFTVNGQSQVTELTHLAKPWDVAVSTPTA